MKKIGTAFLLISFLSVFSQVRTGAHKYEALDPNTAGKIFRNQTPGKDRPTGSPYLMKMFASAKVEGIAKNAFMRYNVFNDEFEFITNNNDTLILDKIEDFGTITFNGLNKKYQLTAYTNTKGKLDYGYLIDFYRKGGVVLYMKENIDFYEAKKAKTSLERDIQARYTKTDDSYFLKIKEAAIAEFPNGKKDLIKLFPDKKPEIETWLKANKVSFGDRADMVRIVDFLATL
ncbi:MAG TPA: hypothetical protein PLS51_08835 [Flavobacterium sp.]|jgi:hypothetical protein|nr:hypothetical protein [Flavobacterium sp.]HPJ10721.1 hypothetical protein [Flavobacterium sp.]